MGRLLLTVALVVFGALRVQAAPPQRIVSGFVGADELLAALHCQPQTVAVTGLSDLPDYATEPGAFPPSVARLHSFEAERILSLEPDLILASPYAREGTVRVLRSLGVQVFPPPRINTLEEVLGFALDLGKAAGREDAARALTAQARQRLAAVRSALADRPRPRVLLYAHGMSPGPGTLDHDKLLAAGGENVLTTRSASGYLNLSLEVAVALQPEVIVVPGSHALTEQQTLEAQFANPLWRQTPACREGRLIVVPANLWNAVSLHAVTHVEYLAARLHGIDLPQGEQP